MAPNCAREGCRQFFFYIKKDFFIEGYVSIEEILTKIATVLFRITLLVFLKGKYHANLLSFQTQKCLSASRIKEITFKFI